MAFMMSVKGNCTEIFDYLSLSAIIADKTFCVHGELSPSINTLDQVSYEYRYIYCMAS